MRALVLLLSAAVVCGFTADARAQAGAGAERYEVTITPPKRPGTETAPAEGDAAKVPTDSAAASPSAAPVDPGNGVASAPASAEAASENTAGALSSPQPPSSLPLRTLQVGAFRQSKSASALQAELSATFPDVNIVQVQSGGEPLYRVFVGKLPHGPALDDLRKKLVAGGHPAFEVALPTMPAAQ